MACELLDSAHASKEIAQFLCLLVSVYLTGNQPLPDALRLFLAEAFLHASESGSVDREIGLQRARGQSDRLYDLTLAAMIARAVDKRLDEGYELTETYTEIAEHFKVDASTVGKKFRAMRDQPGLAAWLLRRLKT